MHKTYRGLIALGLTGGLLFAGTAGKGGVPTRHDTGTGNGTCNTDPFAPGDDTGATTWSPTSLWPPNGAQVTVTIKFTPSAEDAGEGNELAIGTITSSDGGGSSTGSGTSIAETANNQASLTATVTLEASRDGSNSAGRTYTIPVKCSENEGSGPMTSSTTVNLTVTVPHDQGS